MCLGCHSDAATSRGASPVEDGVTCESCHGPAGGWIASHYAGVGTTANPDAEMREKHLANLRAGLRKLEDPEIGRASCRERVWQYVEISVVAVSLKKTKKN